MDDLDTFIKLRYGDISNPEIIDKLPDDVIARIFSLGDPADPSVASAKSLIKNAFNNANNFPRTLREYKIAIRCFLREYVTDLRNQQYDQS